jgi:hypothetical protein
MTDNKVYSLEYDRDGFIYSMHVLGTLEEAQFHSDSLGLSEPQEVVASIPDMRGGLN